MHLKGVLFFFSLLFDSHALLLARAPPLFCLLFLYPPLRSFLASARRGRQRRRRGARLVGNEKRMGRRGACFSGRALVFFPLLFFSNRLRSTSTTMSTLLDL